MANVAQAGIGVSADTHPSDFLDFDFDPDAIFWLSRKLDRERLGQTVNMVLHGTFIFSLL